MSMRAKDDYESENGSDEEEQQSGAKRARKSGGGDVPDRKEKHKVVEQKRREKTKELLADLQDLLPNTEDAGGANLTMNTVLQCAIDFLTQHAANGDNKESAASEDTNNSGLDIDVAYRSGFMMASMGIAYAGVDGTILEVNPAFASMLGYSADQRHKLIGRTLFSLSTPQDMQNTLQAVSRLLSGELTHITLNEHCLRQDGTAGYFSVEMNCLWKHNKAHCIVCFIRPAEEGMQGRQGPQGGHAVDGANGSMQAAFNMSGIPNLPNMPLAGIPMDPSQLGMQQHPQ